MVLYAWEPTVHCLQAYLSSTAAAKPMLNLPLHFHSTSTLWTLPNMHNHELSELKQKRLWVLGKCSIQITAVGHAQVSSGAAKCFSLYFLYMWSLGCTSLSVSCITFYRSNFSNINILSYANRINTISLSIPLLRLVSRSRSTIYKYTVYGLINSFNDTSSVHRL